MNNHRPLVTIGIPTYNRPDGVLNTIKKIVAQSYQNLEIIVSNNCSTNELVVPILEQCARLDKRVKLFHQPENIGIAKNFQFVLSQASGEYFMWAADDDDWDSRFIEVCLQEFSRNNSVGTVMPGFFRYNKAKDVKGIATVPKMTGVNVFSDAMAFYSTYIHSIMYGLHKTSSLEYYKFLSEPEEFDDEYTVLKQILENGVATLPEVQLYTAVIEDAQYQIKFKPEAPDRFFFTHKRLVLFFTLIAECNKLSDLQKIALIQQILIRKVEFTLIFEKEMRNPEQYNLALTLYNLLKAIDPIKIDLYTDVLTSINKFTR